MLDQSQVYFSSFTYLVLFTLRKDNPFPNELVWCLCQKSIVYEGSCLFLDCHFCSLNYMFISFFIFKIGFRVAQAGLELLFLLSWPLECWLYRSTLLLSLCISVLVSFLICETITFIIFHLVWVYHFYLICCQDTFNWKLNIFPFVSVGRGHNLL